MDDYMDNEPSPSAEPKGDDGNKDSPKTFLINKDISPDSKPGEELVVKVERVLESELEVSYAPKKEELASEPSGDDSMDRMFA